jgi:uncharacterized SAM-binding protein YcdF (DUF218 family)
LARFLIGSVLALLLILGWPWAAHRALVALEHVYAPPDQPLTHYAGMIVLSGAVEHYQLFGQSRLIPGEVTPGSLMRGASNWQLVYSGTSGVIGYTGLTEAESANEYFLSQGLDMSRIRFDRMARNTHENAVNVARLLGPQCHDREWLLVTSAMHMPRAMQEFRAEGCAVTAFPVNFQGGVSGGYTTTFDWAPTLAIWQKVLHETVGLMVARWRG